MKMCIAFDHSWRGYVVSPYFWIFLDYTYNSRWDYIWIVRQYFCKFFLSLVSHFIHKKPVLITKLSVFDHWIRLYTIDLKITVKLLFMNQSLSLTTIITLIFDFIWPLITRWISVRILLFQLKNEVNSLFLNPLFLKSV